MQIIVCSLTPFLPEFGTPYHLSIALGQYAEVSFVTPVLSWKQRRAVQRASQDKPVRVIAPFLPGAGRSVPRRWRARLHAFWTARTAQRYLLSALRSPIVIWANCTETALWLDTLLQPSLFCYHRLDDFTAMDARLAPREQQLMQRAHLNFVVAPSLIDPPWMREGSWIYLPNGVATKIFAAAQSESTVIPPDLTALPSPRIGFIGLIHPDWVDVDLVMELARATPQWSWVMIGSKVCWTPPAARPANLYLLGARAYAQLPAYLKGLDVCIIPFRSNAIAQGASPLKLYEYLAAGKVVVSTPCFHDLQQFGDLVYTADALSEWQGALHSALEEAHHPTQVARRMQSVAPHSWQARAHQVMQHLQRALHEMTP